MSNATDYRATMSEAQLQAAVVDLAKLLGWSVFHDHDSRRNPAGLPDLLMVRSGRLLFAELKSARGRLRPEQVRWLDQLTEVTDRSRGVVRTHVWRPEHWFDGTIQAVLR